MIEDLTGNIRRLVDGLADEVARRVFGDLAQMTHENEVRKLVGIHARQVLLDWFLGDYIPSDANRPLRENTGGDDGS